MAYILLSSVPSCTDLLKIDPFISDTKIAQICEIFPAPSLSIFSWWPYPNLQFWSLYPTFLIMNPLLTSFVIRNNILQIFYTVLSWWDSFNSSMRPKPAHFNLSIVNFYRSFFPFSQFIFHLTWCYNLNPSHAWLVKMCVYCVRQ